MYDGVRVNDTIVIGESELSESFVRASGPGGQNVNKVATCVQLRFDAAGSPSLSAPVRARLERLAGRRLNAQGEIVIEARRFRTLERNRSDARERLADLIRRAATPPKPRVATRPTAGSRRRRLDDKRRKGSTKRLRRGPAPDHE